MSPTFQPRISVCIPTYNSADHIGRALASVARQTYRNFEIVIVDDNSRDGTYEFCRNYPIQNLRLYQNVVRRGLVGNHNECLRLARGDLVQYLHADDELSEFCLANMVSLFDDHPAVVLAFAPRRVEGADPEWMNQYGTLHSNFDCLQRTNSGLDLISRYVEAGARTNWIGEPSSVMFKRDAGMSLGGFRPQLLQLLDIDLWLRLMALGNVGWLDTPQAVRHQHGGTASAMNRASGLALLDCAHVYAGLSSNPKLPAALRLKALWRWTVLVAGASRKAVREVARGDVGAARILSTHIAWAARRKSRAVSFCVGRACGR